jgi:adenylate cyclase
MKRSWPRQSPPTGIPGTPHVGPWTGTSAQDAAHGVRPATPPAAIHPDGVVERDGHPAIGLKPAAVLFADVSNSTRYFERYGEVAGHGMIERCLGIIIPEIERHGGMVVKTLGDGLLAVFDRAVDLVGASRALHRALVKANGLAGGSEAISVHCGGDFGPIARDAAGDIFGDVVNVAARLQALAARDQTLVTRELVNTLEQSERGEIRYVGSFPVHGRGAQVETYEIEWRVGTRTVLIARADLKLESTLSLQFQDKTIELPPDRDGLTIGRGAGNNLIVEDAAVSREHAEIVRRKGLLYLVDRSTNGTFLQTEGGIVRHVQHAEVPLEGRGRIVLGRIDGPPLGFRVTLRVS